MIIDKTIKFGYGTTLISSNGTTRRITMMYIEPPIPISGHNLENKDLKDTVIIEEIHFSYESDMDKFIKELGSVSENNPILTFRGYTFDFSNYNEKSVNALINGLKVVIRGWQLGLAC